LLTGAVENFRLPLETWEVGADCEIEKKGGNYLHNINTVCDLTLVAI
jgi:hypothetical protein